MLVAQPIQPTLIRSISDRAAGRIKNADDSYAFPEHRFRPDPAQRELYARRVASGFTEMSQRRVVIAGSSVMHAEIKQGAATLSF